MNRAIFFWLFSSKKNSHIRIICVSDKLFMFHFLWIPPYCVLCKIKICILSKSNKETATKLRHRRERNFLIQFFAAFWVKYELTADCTTTEIKGTIKYNCYEREEQALKFNEKLMMTSMKPETLSFKIKSEVSDSVSSTEWAR